MVCRINDAFTNQHSLIPPSFGGPQIHVAVPRVTDAATSESHDSQSTTQTVMSSEFDDVVETGHDVVKDLFSDGVNYQEPEELMSAAERSSISAAGAGFDAALRRASAPQPADMCINVSSVTAETSSDNLSNGETTAPCSTAWRLLNPGGLERAASDSSIASSVGSILEGSSMDLSRLVCRTAAVAGQSSFKTHALTERPSDARTVTVSNVDDSNASLTNKILTHDNDGSPASEQHSINEFSAVANNDNDMQRHC